MARFNEDYTFPSNKRDLHDAAMLARHMMSLTRCPGGRLTAKGYICTHCGMDYSMYENKEFCGQPVREDGFETFDAFTAREVMLKSEEKFGGE
jgi:hypothetical protein